MINILKLREMQKKAEEDKSESNESKKPEKTVEDKKSGKQRAKKNIKIKKKKSEEEFPEKKTDEIKVEENKPEFEVLAEPEIKDETETPAEVNESEKVVAEDPAEKLRKQLLEELMLSNEPTGFEISQEEDLEEELAAEETELIEESETMEQEKQIPEENEIEPEEIKVNIPEDLQEKIEEESITVFPKQIEEISGELPEKRETIQKSELKKEEKKENEEIQLVGFILGNEHFGIPIDKIQEINRMSDITKVPNAPMYVEGVMNLRGAVLPVVNLRIKIGMPTIEYDSKSRIIIIEIEDMTIGFIVDEVREVLRINKSQLAPPPEISSNMDTDYITAVAKLEDELVILIDPERLFLENK